MPGFNQQIKQVLILALLIAIILLALRELYLFLPGLLGALTLYILSRGSYFQMIYNRKKKKGQSAALFILGYLLVLCLIIYLTVALLGPKVQPFFDHPSLLINMANKTIADIHQNTGIEFISENTTSDLMNRLTSFVPRLINNTVDLMINLILMLFMLYYMLVNGKEMEQYLVRIIPLKSRNIDLLAAETKKIVKASAMGIPLISIIQGLTATLGYFIFGVDEFILWGFLTGIFAFFPVVGTMVVWVPLVLFMYGSGQSLNATWLLLYSLLVTGNIDYLARITLLKRMGNVSPVITVLGVIVGLGLFGFIGLIFGPLLVNYIILIFRIYSNEFLEDNQDA